MGKRGPKPIPTEILKRRFSRAIENRGQEVSVSSDDFDSDCPEWLDSLAREQWFKIVPRLKNLGVIGDIDFNVVSQYCHWWSKFVMTVKDCPNDIHGQSKASEQVLKLCAKLGLSPSDRVGLSVDKKDDKKDKFSRIV